MFSEIALSWRVPSWTPDVVSSRRLSGRRRSAWTPCDTAAWPRCATASARRTARRRRWPAAAAPWRQRTRPASRWRRPPGTRPTAPPARCVSWAPGSRTWPGGQPTRLTAYRRLTRLTAHRRRRSPRHARRGWTARRYRVSVLYDGFTVC